MVEQIPSVVITETDQYQVRRAWPRTPGHALLELTDAAGGIVAGQWFASDDELREAAASTPEPSFSIGSVLIQPAGADDRLKALRKVAAAPGASLLVHRPSRRGVVRNTDAAGNVVAYTKVVRRSRADDVAQRGRVAASVLRDIAQVPELLVDSDVPQGILRWSVVPGATLADLGQQPDWQVDDARRVWAAAGRATAALHGAERDAVADLHDPAEEVRALHKWLPLAVHFGLLDADRVSPALAAVERDLLAPVDQPVLGVLHRDLHDKQLLIDDAGRIGLIDVDTLAVGERALDIANLLVHLELREMQGLLAADTAAASREAFLAEVDAAKVPTDRIEVYRRSTFLRLAAVYAFRPKWRDISVQLLDRVAA